MSTNNFFATIFLYLPSNCVCKWVVYSKMSNFVWTCISHISLFISVFWQVIFVNEKKTSKPFDLGPSYQIINVVWFFTTIHISKRADYKHGSEVHGHLSELNCPLDKSLSDYVIVRTYHIEWNHVIMMKIRSITSNSKRKVKLFFDKNNITHVRVLNIFVFFSESSVGPLCLRVCHEYRKW